MRFDPVLVVCPRRLGELREVAPAFSRSNCYCFPRGESVSASAKSAVGVRDMAIGINPTVDFAFKMLYGNPEHPGVTIHFLNSMLEGPKIS